MSGNNIHRDTHEGRVAVVTGAARGFGQAIALGLAQRGATIAVVDLLDGADTVAVIEGAGGAASAHHADLADEASVDAAVQEVLARHDRVDILVNNAGIIAKHDFFQTDYATWQKVMAVNLGSQFLMSKAVAPSMRDNGWGRVVNVASNTLGLVAPHVVAYMASKGGVVGFTRGLATDLAPFGITVNAVHPTASRTPGGQENIGDENLQRLAELQAIKRVGQPQDIVGTVCFLASDDAAFLTGQTIVVDGGRMRV